MKKKSPKLVVILNELDTLISPNDERALIRLAREVEDAGYFGIATSEHVALGPNSAFTGMPENPREFLMPGNQSPFQHWPNPFIKLAAFAAVTERVQLCAMATLAPLRHPLLNAKELATLDLISGGRVSVVPIGGWNEFEYEAMGIPYRERGARLDEHLEILDLVSRESPATYNGKHYSFQDVYLQPKPVQPGGITIWVGGDRMTKKVVERIVRFGRGFCLMHFPDAAEMAYLQSEMTKAGRDVSELECFGCVYPTFADRSAPADIEQTVAESLLPQVEAGATALSLKPSQYIDDVRDVPKFLKKFSDCVERAFR